MPRALRALAALLAVGFALFFATPARAFTPPPLPYGSYVVDTAGRLTPEEIRYFDAKLARIHQAIGARIAVFVCGSLEGENDESVAYQTARAWGVGEKGKDNGVLLLIAPNYPQGQRKVRIEVGKGLEGDLTDLQSNDIIRHSIVPMLRQQRVRDAVDAGTDAIASTLGYTGGATTRRPSSTARPAPHASGGSTLGSLIVLFVLGVPVGVILLIVILARLRGGGGGGSYGGGYGGGYGGYSGGGSDWGGGGGGGDDGGGDSGAGGGGDFGGGGSGESY